MSFVYLIPFSVFSLFDMRFICKTGREISQDHLNTHAYDASLCFGRDWAATGMGTGGFSLAAKHNEATIDLLALV